MRRQTPFLLLLALAGCSTPAPPPSEALHWWSSAEGWSQKAEQDRRERELAERKVNEARAQQAAAVREQARAAAQAALRKQQEHCFKLGAAMDALQPIPSEPAEHEARVRAVHELAVSVEAKPRRFPVKDLRIFSRDSGALLRFIPFEVLHEVADCGEERVLVARVVTRNEGDFVGSRFFEFAVVPRADLAAAPPTTCEVVSQWVLEDASLIAPRYGPRPEWPRRAVTEESVAVRVGPSPQQRALQKLGFGTELSVASEACPGWPLVMTPYGAGFVRDDEVRAELPDDAALQARQEAATSPLLALRWALIRAQRHPTEANLQTARELQRAVGAHPETRAPCEQFSGGCAASLDESRREFTPHLDAVPTGPWWVLPSEAEAAVIGLFRAAWLIPRAGCAGSGPECGPSLRFSFERLGAHIPTEVVAASRRPDPSWFKSMPTAGCATAEASARASARWAVPLFGNDAAKPAREGAGRCVAAPNGGVWWIQEWRHPEMSEMESDTVLRTYRVVAGRVVEVARLAQTSGSGLVSLAQSASLPPPWRVVRIR